MTAEDRLALRAELLEMLAQWDAMKQRLDTILALVEQPADMPEDAPRPLDEDTEFGVPWIIPAMACGCHDWVRCARHTLMLKSLAERRDWRFP